MNDITIIDQNVPDFLREAGLSALTKQLAGRTGAKRIVPRNGIFRKVVGGEEMGKVKGPINTIVVNASPHVGRIFYLKQWSPDAEPSAPDCFSNDGRTPDAGANNPQSERCDTCPQNVKGSGQGQSKACRYSRRLAVLLEEDFGTALEGHVYQINLASKSLFGDSPSDKIHPFENYSKYLANNGKNIDHLVTTIMFNEDNDNQSVLFTANRYINRHEFEVLNKVSVAPETQRLVVMTPYQADASGRSAPKQIAAPAPAEEAEPVKRETRKPEAPPAEKKDLKTVLKDWTSEE
jgi:hypothetical protein